MESNNILESHSTTIGNDSKSYVLYFYEGLMPMDRSTINAASGGALVDKTPEATRNFIANMVTIIPNSSIPGTIYCHHLSESMR